MDVLFDDHVVSVEPWTFTLFGLANKKEEDIQVCNFCI